MRKIYLEMTADIRARSHHWHSEGCILLTVPSFDISQAQSIEVVLRDKNNEPMAVIRMPWDAVLSRPLEEELEG